MSGLNGRNGFKISGINTEDFSGTSISSAGDLNGDGIDDLLIGAASADPAGRIAAGETYVVFGQAPTFTWETLIGGAWETDASYDLGYAPITGSHVVLAPQFGGTIAGPGTGFTDVRTLTVGAQLGVATFAVGAAPVQVRDLLTIEATGRLTGQSGSVLAALGTLDNAGEVDLKGMSLAGGTLANQAGGLLGGAGVVSMAVDNAGSIEAVSQAGELVFNGVVSNQAGGLVAVVGSNVRFNAGLNNSGQVSAGDGLSVMYGDVNNAAGGTIGVSGAAVASVVGDLDQEGTLNLTAGGRLVVFGNYTGSGGASGAGTLEVLGLFSPGSSPAATSYGGGLVTSGGTLIEIAGTEPGQFDSIAVDGDLAIGGALTVSLLGGFEPVHGDVFLIAEVGGVLTGEYDGLGEGATIDLPGGTDLVISYAAGDGNDIALTGFNAFALPGDTDGDGDVDDADLGTMFSNFTGPTGAAGGKNFADGDTEGDGDVDDSDLANAFVGFTGPLTLANVPEPGSLALLALGTLACSRRRRS